MDGEWTTPKFLTWHQHTDTTDLTGWRWFPWRVNHTQVVTSQHYRYSWLNWVKLASRAGGTHSSCWLHTKIQTQLTSLGGPHPSFWPHSTTDTADLTEWGWLPWRVEHTQIVDFTPKYGHSWVHWVDHTQHYRHSWLSDTDFPWQADHTQVVDLTPTYRRSRLQWMTLAPRHFPRWASQVDSL